MPSGQATPDQLRGLVEADLRSLGLDRLDLVYLRVGGMTGPGGESIAERFAVLAELREEGLIRHLGVSNVDAAQFAEAQAIAPSRRCRTVHADDPGLLAQCEEAGIAFVPFFPLGGGRSRSTPNGSARSRPVMGATTAQVAIAALLATSPSVLAIPGTGSPRSSGGEPRGAGAQLSARRTCPTCEARRSRGPGRRHPCGLRRPRARGGRSRPG